MTTFLRRDAVEHAFRRLEGRVVLDAPSALKVTTIGMTAAAAALALGAWTLPIAVTEDVPGTTFYPGPASTLRATAPGVVAAIYPGAGDVVRRGDPIARIVSAPSGAAADRLGQGDASVRTIATPVTGRIASVVPEGRLVRTGQQIALIVPEGASPLVSFALPAGGALPKNGQVELRYVEHGAVRVISGAARMVDADGLRRKIVVTLHPAATGAAPLPASLPVTGRFVVRGRTIGAMLVSPRGRAH